MKIIIARNHDRSFGAGLEIYTHKHMTECFRHTHVLIVFGFWFFELQIGKDIPKRSEE